jgi:hypothetical protein
MNCVGNLKPRLVGNPHADAEAELRGEDLSAPSRFCGWGCNAEAMSIEP